MDTGILRCVRDVERRRCFGRVEPRADGLVCTVCQAEYTVIKGVPVFRPGPVEQLIEEGDYNQRSRTKELIEGVYDAERRLLDSWFKRYNLTGPTLEIGCGNGLLAPVLPDFHGLEHSLRALLDPGWKTEPRVCGDAQVLPFADAKFKVLVSLNVFEHVPAIDRIYGELDRVLRPGGMMFLRPAWHSLKAYTEAIPIRPYSDLTFRQKLVKLLLPVIMSKPYKLLTRIPPRVARRLLTRGPQPMRWTPLTPYPHPQGKFSLPKWLPDTDAAASIDPHETIMYFIRRGYQPLSHRTVLRQIFAGHDWVILRKA